MAVEFRQLLSEEMIELGRMGAYVYAGAFGDGDDNKMSTSLLPQWTLCALEDGKLLSSFVDLPFTMRANGKAMPMCGVSVIGTFPEYRRRGLVRRLHTLAFENLHNQERSLAGLWASQAAIYQRYGYAQATVLRSYAIDTVDIGFFDGDNGLGNVRRIDTATCYETLKSIYIDFIAPRSGYLHRAKALWLTNALDAKAAGGPIHVAISHDINGTANGYVAYSLRADKIDHPTRSQEIEIRDLAWLSQDAYRSLWSWLARHDLVGRVRWDRAPIDDPAPALFVEPRLLRTQDREGEWLRVVDLPGALCARGYDSAGELSISIKEDQMAPWNIGTFRLTAAPEGTKVERMGDKHAGGDLTMSIKTLALLVSGSVRAYDLAGWGLIEGSRAAIGTANQLFATRYRPHCPDIY